VMAFVMTMGAGAALASGGSSSSELIQSGSSGATIASVQRALGLSPDGVYGADTKRAVMSFQRVHGLIVDGIVGPQTLNALGLGGSEPPDAGAGSGIAPSPELEKIARCESGGDPTAISPTGQYRGKYQFSRATWRSLGGSGDPARAPEAQQDRMAELLLHRSGTSAWPVCGRS
jgi:peptidoglycan hydrolase-like protein with peptidoglycan-binding domain